MGIYVSAFKIKVGWTWIEAIMYFPGSVFIRQMGVENLNPVTNHVDFFRLHKLPDTFFITSNVHHIRCWQLNIRAPWFPLSIYCCRPFPLQFSISIINGMMWKARNRTHHSLDHIEIQWHAAKQTQQWWTKNLADLQRAGLFLSGCHMERIP